MFHPFSILFTLWLFNIAMENCPFIDDFPIKTSIYEGFSMAMLNKQRVFFDLLVNHWTGVCFEYASIQLLLSTFHIHPYRG